MKVEIKELETNLTEKEKKQNLFNNQKNLLELFLSKNAISKAQYNKSLSDLKLKMGI